MEIRSSRDLGAAVRGRRLTLGLSQNKVGEAAGVSRPWLADFEAGRPTVELGRVLSVLSALDFTFDLRGPDETPAIAGTPPGDLEDLDSLVEDYDKGVDS